MKVYVLKQSKHATKSKVKTKKMDKKFNRTTRRGRVTPMPRPNDSLNRFKQGGGSRVRTKVPTGIEALHSPLKIPLRKSRSKVKNFANRCCYVTPKRKSFGQYFAGRIGLGCKNAATGPAQPIDRDQLETLIKDQYNIEPGISATTYQLESKKNPRNSRNKIKPKQQSHSSNSAQLKKAVFDESHWQKLDSPEEVDTLIPINDVSGLDISSNHIFISEEPHVKVIAAKFSKYKRGNLELRRLDEKVICVEYDIFNQSCNQEVLKPVQRMRAFFSIKPFDNDSNEKQVQPRLPPNIKNEFNVLDEDFEKLTEKEIEFIDYDIAENQSYLDDLRRILKRKEVMNAKKNKTSLDLQCLYEMARRDGRPMGSDFSETNCLSKGELKGVKQLILQHCTTSIHGFRRRTIRNNGPTLDPGAISNSIISEMLQYKS